MRRRPTRAPTSRCHPSASPTPRTGSGLPNAGSTLTTAAPTLTVQVTGLGTVPAGASAAVLNVAVTNTMSAGFLTVFQAGITRPTVSNLNFVASETVANLVTVPLERCGRGARSTARRTDADVVVDVEGYYTSAPAANGYGLYNAMSPVRDLGTLALGAAVAAATSVPVTVAGGTTTVPANASAVVVNVTAAHDSVASFLSVYPAPAVTTEPTFSNLNFSAGEAVANRAIVAVGTGGVIEVYNHAGTLTSTSTWTGTSPASVVPARTSCRLPYRSAWLTPARPAW